MRSAKARVVLHWGKSHCGDPVKGLSRINEVNDSAPWLLDNAPPYLDKLVASELPCH